MAKKKRSRKSSAARRKRPQVQAARQPAARVEQSVQPAPSTASRGVDFAGEYRYVLDDLKRFAVLALAMFATLVVLALVIR